MARAGTKNSNKIDALMERAGEALSRGEYFECERLCDEALSATFRARDFERMARIVLPLEEARRQKRLAAADAGLIVAIDGEAGLDGKIEPGCYLIEPMLVGADGRDFRDRADELEVPVIVIVHEPVTQLKRWPIVMVGQTTIRTTVEPPSKKRPLDVEWFLEAGEALGDAAIDEVEVDLPAETRVERLLQRVQTLRDHDKLHQALMEACRDAVHEQKS